MDSDSLVEKTHEPTPRRKEKAREKGLFAVSGDVNSAAVVLAGALVLMVSGAGLFYLLGQCLARGLALPDASSLARGDLHGALGGLARDAGLEFLGFLGILFLAALVSGGVQTGFRPVWKNLRIDFSRMNPASGLARLVSKDSLYSVGKTLLILAGIGCALAAVLMRLKDQTGMLVFWDQGRAAGFAGGRLTHLLFLSGLCLVLVAVLDFFYQRARVKKKLRMSREEITREQKETEGDPLAREKRRAAHRSVARKGRLGTKNEREEE